MDDLDAIFGNPEKIGAKVREVTNQWAALEAQNADIAGGRWTLNNAVYQFNQLSQVGQVAVMGALAWIVVAALKKV